MTSLETTGTAEYPKFNPESLPLTSYLTRTADINYPYLGLIIVGTVPLDGSYTEVDVPFRFMF